MSFFPSQPKRFCSRDCDTAWRRLTNNPRKPKRGTTTPCETCGAPVYAAAYARSTGQGRYCSLACHNIGQKRPETVKPCAQCGVELRLKPSQSHRKYCTKACEGLARTKRPLGRTHNGKPARLDIHGYVLVWQPDFPAPKGMKGWAYEHRVIASQIVGRPLTSDEQVDHINRNRQDNRLENLQVLDQFGHAAKTANDQRQDRLDLAEYRRRYGSLKP